MKTTTSSVPSQRPATSSSSSENDIRKRGKEVKDNEEGSSLKKKVALTHDAAVRLHHAGTETDHLTIGSLERRMGGGQALPEIQGGVRREDRDPALAQRHPEVFPLSNRDHPATQ